MIIVKEIKGNCYKNIYLVNTRPFSIELPNSGDRLSEFCFIREVVAVHDNARCKTTFSNGLFGKCQISILICPFISFLNDYLRC